MTREEYTAQVLAALRRVTRSEREAIRAEIDAHMEDHICALLDLGYEPELAEERTMALMGDPEEVGRELDKQYPLRWLVIGRIALVLTWILCFQALIGLGILFHARDSIVARVAPSYWDRMDDSDQIVGINVRTVVGNDVLRAYQIAVWDLGSRPVAEIRLCAYDRIPGGIVSEGLLSSVTLEDQRGVVQEDDRIGGSGRKSWGVGYRAVYIAVQEGDTYVTLRCGQYGERASMRIPLPKEAVS